MLTHPSNSTQYNKSLLHVLITCPSLDADKNISGISSVAKFIISNNKRFKYQHFGLGKTDKETRGLFWFLRTIKAWVLWFWLMISKWDTIIHFNISLTMRSALRDLPLILLAQVLRKKIIIHIHGGDYLENRIPPQAIVNILKLSLSGETPKIVLSETEKNLLESRYHAKQVFVLPNCIDLTDARKLEHSNKSKLPLELLFLGRIDVNKGLEYIYLALKELIKRNPDSFSFTMAGTGPDKEYFISKFSASLGSSFKYAGVVTGSVKTELLKNSNVFLLPSLYEGLPISLLENMAFGNVPVVTNVGSVGTVVKNGENGIVVKKQSSDEILDALGQLINDPELIDQLGVKAREQIFQNFSPEKYIRELNNIYDKVYLPKIEVVQ